ncbi:MAG: peptidoglycan DD-metalloendopeptidase family protein [Alphaproteobacteria bacterium]|nr:peptidoglycan DD-metalloendopeptidase family protein [Alphaproteobacteria bacterium]
MSPVAERYESKVPKPALPRGRVAALRAAMMLPLLALATASVAGLLGYNEAKTFKSFKSANASLPTKDMTDPPAPLFVTAAVPAPAPTRIAPQMWGTADLDSLRDADSLVRLVGVADWRLEENLMRERSRQIIRVGKGDTLSTLLTGAGVAREDALQTVSALKRVYDPRRIWPGQEIALKFDPLVDDPAGYQGLSIDRSYDRQIVVARDDDGSFGAKEVRRALTQEPRIGGGVITSSLFETGAAAGMPPAVLVEMIRAFSYDVDFQREIRQGDSFEVLYERIKDDTGEVVHPGKVVYAELVLSGKEKRLFRFTPKSGITDFFHDNGHSVRRALLRTPIDGARISSGFGKRRHPILGYNKMHKGLDFAAARGTPIYAAGDGKIEKAGRNGGYGKYVRIRHSGDYKTAYAHLHRIQKGIKPGKRVKQGQVVGYVGSTGRSTGPHLHYEVHVKGRQVNPLSVKLPAGEKLKGNELEAFRTAKAEIERTYASVAGVTRVAQNAHQ